MAIESGSSLTIATDGALTIAGNLNNAGTLSVASSSSASGSLIIKGTATNTGTVNIGRYISNDNQWHFLSSPVAAQDIRPDFVVDGETLPTDFDFFSYSETATDGFPWINSRDGSNAYATGFDTQFGVGKGYLVAYTEGYSADKVFSGTPNTGAQNISLTFTDDGSAGWNLIGNPYSSAIDWSTVDKDPLAEDFYFVYNGTDYIYHNGTTDSSGATKYISQGQGFFVKATEAGALSLTSDNQAHNAQNFIKSEKTDLDELALVLSHASEQDETKVGYNKLSSMDKDRSDASKLYGFSQTKPYIYSLTRDNIQVAYNNLPEITNETTLELGVYIQENGEHVINLTGISGVFTQGSIYLTDRKEGIETNLTENPAYPFMASTDDDANRFFLHFSGITGIHSQVTSTNDLAYIYSSGDKVYVKLKDNKPTNYKVAVYNLMGQQIVSPLSLTNDNSSLTLSQGSGIYFVQVSNGQQVQNQKIYIK